MGKLTSAWETLVGRNPKQAVIENLRHFKALAETGEIPRVQGQPHGDRGIINNHYKGQAAVNAIDLKCLLGIKDNPVPEELRKAYPQLGGKVQKGERLPPRSRRAKVSQAAG